MPEALPDILGRGAFSAIPGMTVPDGVEHMKGASMSKQQLFSVEDKHRSEEKKRKAQRKGVRRLIWMLMRMIIWLAAAFFRFFDQD